ncbi:Uncharacterised protein [Klebsiella pneumoniae]|nr:Uncharacterised protein [Klebsiella pneumoniae]
MFHRLLNTIVEVGFGIAEHRFAFGGGRRGGGWRGYRRRGVADGYRTRAGGAEQRPHQHAGSAISFHFQLQHAIGGMFSDRIRDIRGRIAGAFGIGFRRIQQGRGLLEIFFSGKHQHIELLLAQRRGQAHHAAQAVSGHHARLLIGKVIAGEERRGRHVLVENQHVRRKNLLMFVQFAVERQGQLTDIGRHAPGGDRSDDPRDIQALTAGS